MKTTYRQIMQKTRLSLMFFFVRHHDLLKQRAILGFETTNQETGLKVPIFCLSPCAGTHPRIWLIQTSRLFSNFLLYVMLAVDMWFLRSIDICIFQCCLYCALLIDIQTTQTQKQKATKTNKKNKKTYWARVSVCDCCVCLFGFGFVLFIVYLSIYIYICIYIYIDTII